MKVTISTTGVLGAPKRDHIAFYAEQQGLCDVERWCDAGLCPKRTPALREGERRRSTSAKALEAFVT